MTTANLTGSVDWDSGTPTVLDLTAGGLGTGLMLGTSVVTATDPSSMIFGDTTVTVMVPVLVSIAVTPASPTLFVNDTQQFTATGTYSDSSTANITGAVTWDSGTPAVLDLTAGGLGTALSGGTSVVTATDIATNVMGTTTVTVAALVSIAVTPANPTFFVSQNRQFTAMGTYSNAQVINITGSVTWTSNNPNVLGMNASGQGTGIAPGTAKAIATDPVSNIAGNTDTTVFISYANNIQPIFNQNCVTCHPNNGGLNLTTYNNLMAGGNSGAVIVASNAANSLLWQRIEGIVMPQMPVGGSLPQSQRDRIRDWINAGALNN
jgi:mono/diheme cytochrome c family protein